MERLDWEWSLEPSGSVLTVYSLTQKSISLTLTLFVAKVTPSPSPFYLSHALSLSASVLTVPRNEK